MFCEQAGLDLNIKNQSIFCWLHQKMFTVQIEVMNSWNYTRNVPIVSKYVIIFFLKRYKSFWIQNKYNRLIIRINAKKKGKKISHSKQNGPALSNNWPTRAICPSAGLVGRVDRVGFFWKQFVFWNSGGLRICIAKCAYLCTLKHLLGPDWSDHVKLGDRTWVPWMAGLGPRIVSLLIVSNDDPRN